MQLQSLKLEEDRGLWKRIRWLLQHDPTHPFGATAEAALVRAWGGTWTAPRRRIPTLGSEVGGFKSLGLSTEPEKVGLGWVPGGSKYRGGTTGGVGRICNVLYKKCCPPPHMIKSS